MGALRGDGRGPGSQAGTSACSEPEVGDGRGKCLLFIAGKAFACEPELTSSTSSLLGELKTVLKPSADLSNEVNLIFAMRGGILVLYLKTSELLM